MPITVPSRHSRAADGTADALRWMALAKQARDMADRMLSSDAKRRMLEMAEDCDALSREAELVATASVRARR